jgi:hypothetical protein
LRSLTDLSVVFAFRALARRWRLPKSFSLFGWFRR